MVSDLLERARDWAGDPLERVRRVDLRADAIAVHIDLSSLLREGSAGICHVLPIGIRHRGQCWAKRLSRAASRR
jgi:hypothetical protein